LDRIVAERRRQSTVDDNRRTHAAALEVFETWVETSLFAPDGSGAETPAPGDRDAAPADDVACDAAQEAPVPGLDDPAEGRASHGGSRSATPHGTEVSAPRPATGPLRRPLHRFPFVPDDPARLAQDC